MATALGNAAINFQPEAYALKEHIVLGRHSAGVGFLHGFLRHAGVEPFYCFADSSEQFGQFRQAMDAAGVGQRNVRWIPTPRRDDLEAPGCLYHPDPDLTRHAWLRRFGRSGQRAYSLCGITHTICTAFAMEAVGGLLTAPVQSWDALICTSHTARQVAQGLLTRWGEYLADRLQARPQLSAELPVIPLGVDCETFQNHPELVEAGRQIRAQLGANGENDVVALYVGRLSFHAKGHPLPMFLAMEQAARTTGKRLFLVHVGRFGSKTVSDQYQLAAAAWCPSVKCLFLDGLRPNILPAAWFAADFFTSLADNIQETFGLTPIEAMAAGLPSVVTDWDGYRDTVRHGVDGMRIPTAMPSEPAVEFARRYFDGSETYDRYVGHISQFTSVDVGSCTTAYTRLIENPALRASMGDAAKRRAREIFDWRVVIRSYQDLWAELATRRREATEIAAPAPNRPPHPLHDDPLRTFNCYPTLTVQRSTVVAAGIADAADHLERLIKDPMTNFAVGLLAPREECLRMVDAVRRQKLITVAELADSTPPELRHFVERTIGWMLKTDLLRLAEPGEVRSKGGAAAGQ